MDSGEQIPFFWPAIKTTWPSTLASGKFGGDATRGDYENLDLMFAVIVYFFGLFV